MKNFIYVFIASLAMISCQNEDLVTENVSVENAKVQLVQVTDNGQMLPVGNLARTVNSDASYVLQFDSKSTYDVIIKQLGKMSSKEKLAFAESYGLHSLQQLAIVADEELEQIGAEASSEADFREKYEAYKAKYTNILISNPYDSSDLSLYVPDGDKLSTYLINSNCMVAIGDKLEKIRLQDDMSASDKSAFVSDIPTPVALALADDIKWYTNKFNEKYYDGKKKLNFELSVQNPSDYTMNVHMGAQKSMWYGWKRDSAREFYYESYLENFVYLMYANNHIAVAPRAERYCHKDCGGKFDVVLGKRGTFTNQPIAGKMFVWTDCIAEVGANNQPAYENKQVLIGGRLQTASVRKCVGSKAFHVKVSL